MEIITTHVNADFDAFASMLAAQKLYPNAVVAFPGSQEKSLRDFFMESTLYILSIERAKDIDLDKVTRLILVDTRQMSRIGRFAELVESRKPEIHIYDHHPDAEDDVKGDYELIRPLGSTTALLIRLIRARDIDINAEEATVLSLGIYEDTGSFTFSSTTAEDLEAAAWLLGKGANLNVISNMMTTDLSRDQVEVLHQLIEGTEIVNIGGVEVVITTAGAEGYVGDLAILVHKLKDMENFEAIFAVIRMDDRVHLIARSSVDEVNAAEIAAEFGGGGHPTAASANIKDMTIHQARDKLIALLGERVRPKRTAAEIMSRPVITIGPDKTIEKAAELLSRYQISSLPVVQDTSILGILHRNSVEKALHHGLELARVSEYMNPGMVFVTPEQTIEQVTQTTVDTRQRIIPVVDDDRIVGVISRSDLLEHMKLPRRSDSAGPEEYPVGRARSRSVRKPMEELLPDRIINILRHAGAIAERRGEEAYVVGGAVRDFLLRNHNLDIDLVIEGAGISFARELARDFEGCRVRGHEKFGTAVILFPDGFKIDVATARHEYYARPGALPTVETSSIKRDLYRRDFTMNTLAVNLNTKSFGQLIDFFGGARDIKEKVIRVLHNLAFVEDPTRIMRAIRFSTRFSFAISKHTLTLMRGALKMQMFDKIEGKRLLNELIHILNEKNPIPALNMMAGFGIPQALHPALNLTSRTFELMESISGVLSWWKYLFAKDSLEIWVVYFLGFTESLGDEEFDQVMKRLSIIRPKLKDLGQERAQIRRTLAAFSRDQLDRPSRIVETLRRFSMEALLFMMARTARQATRMAISEYITTLRHTHALLTGKDLIALGYEPGPIFAKILTALRDARLDGEVVTKQDEIDLVRKTSTFPTEDQIRLTK